MEMHLSDSITGKLNREKQKDKRIWLLGLGIHLFLVISILFCFSLFVLSAIILVGHFMFFIATGFSGLVATMSEILGSKRTRRDEEKIRPEISLAKCWLCSMLTLVFLLSNRFLSG